MKIKPVIIVGGGASGLIAAILIAREGIAVTLLEQNSKIGKKILVSGNGQCNITHHAITPDRFHSQDPDFVAALLDGYGYEAIKHFFATVGLPLIEGKEGKVFPMSLRAGNVVKLLMYEAERVGVEIVCDCFVSGVEKEGDCFVLETTHGAQRCERLVLAAGSPAAPQLGGTVSGLSLAASLGHRLIPSYPSLVQLCSQEQWVKEASGVKVAGSVKFFANGALMAEKSGDLLFTTYGISGLAILDISREVSLQLAQQAYCELHLDLLPKMSKENLTQFLLGHIQTKSQKPLSVWLLGMFNEKLIPVFLEQSGCRAKIERELNRKEVGKLVYALKNLKLPINDTYGFKGAEVATGGVDTTEVESTTLASKKSSGLYLTGEILDVDGDRGGFNFHFAWVSGMRAAKGIVECIRLKR